LSYDLPVVVEIVDTETKINEFLPVLDGMITSGLIKLEKVQVRPDFGPSGHAGHSKGNRFSMPMSRTADCKGSVETGWTMIVQ
jgi:hypothetical protein